MERGKYRTILASLVGGLWMLMVVGLSLRRGSQASGGGRQGGSSCGYTCGARSTGNGCAGAETATLFYGDQSGSKDIAVAGSNGR